MYQYGETLIIWTAEAIRILSLGTHITDVFDPSQNGALEVRA